MDIVDRYCTLIGQFYSKLKLELIASSNISVKSVFNHHANCMAELAVKTFKRMVADNTGPTGSWM